MKFIKTFIVLFIITVIALGAYAFSDYQKVLKESAPIQTLTFNDVQINYKNASVEYHILNGLIPINRDFQNLDEANLISTNIVNTLSALETDQIEITYPDGTIQNVVGVSQINLEENGTYLFKILRTQDKTNYQFEFSVDVDSRPTISISNQNPVQGELLIVEINNIPLNSQIDIDNHFRPSAIIQKDYKARFYLPMAYREAAKVYPLTLSINNQTYNYELDVKTYEFKEIHFTVNQTVVSSTVGNNDAVTQYRETIYPLYETFETEEYWVGNFINPVEGARISSTFGEMRFVNNAKTPSRHAGIDYAIKCGTDVLASNAGKVEYAGFLTMIGNTIVIDHGLGLKTFYEHMEDITITQGDMVEKGQLIGHVGTTGYSTGCHLHFQAMVKNQSINPEFLYTIND